LKPYQTLVREFGSEVNIEKTRYIFTSGHQNAGQNYNVERPNNSFENVPKFKYLGKTLKMKITSTKNYDNIKFGEFFIPFSSGSFDYPSPT